MEVSVFSGAVCWSTEERGRLGGEEVGLYMTSATPGEIDGFSDAEKMGSHGQSDDGLLESYAGFQHG